MRTVTLTTKMIGEGLDSGEGFLWLRPSAQLGENLWVEMTWDTEDESTALPVKAWEPRVEVYAVDADGNDLCRECRDLALEEAVALLATPVDQLLTCDAGFFLAIIAETVKQRVAELAKGGV